MIAFLWIPGWWWHPLNGQGYQWWSGIGSDIAEITLLTAVVGTAIGAYRHRECHVEGCYWPAWHPDPKHGHPVCKKHHSQSGKCVADPDGGSMMLEDDD